MSQLTKRLKDLYRPEIVKILTRNNAFLDGGAFLKPSNGRDLKPDNLGQKK
jgi:hypothetical protein